MDDCRVAATKAAARRIGIGGSIAGRLRPPACLARVPAASPANRLPAAHSTAVAASRPGELCGLLPFASSRDDNSAWPTNSPARGLNTTLPALKHEPKERIRPNRIPTPRTRYRTSPQSPPATIPGRGRSNTKLLGAQRQFRFGRARLHQFTELLGSLRRIRARRKPEACESGAVGREFGIAHVRVLDRVHPDGADIRRAGGPALAAPVDRAGRGLLELRHRAVWICRQLPDLVRGTRRRRSGRSRLRYDCAEFAVGLLSRAPARARDGHFLLR